MSRLVNLRIDIGGRRPSVQAYGRSDRGMKYRIQTVKLDKDGLSGPRAKELLASAVLELLES